jgi:hypothetical protein
VDGNAVSRAESVYTNDISRLDSLDFRFSDQPRGQVEAAGDAAIGSPVPLAVRQQHDLAEHSAFAQHLVRAARLFEGQPLRDQGLDLALFE